MAVVLLGFAMRTHWLGLYSLWLDELGQASVATLGLREAIQGAKSHLGAAPLDYVLTWLALQLAHDDFAVRLPAALLGTLTLALVYRLGREFFDAPTGVLAGLLLAVAPLHLRYSQEARFYALFTCMTVASMLALAIALRRGTDPKAWAVYALVLAAGFYSHYYMVLIMLVQAILVAVSQIWPQTFPAGAEHPQGRRSDQWMVRVFGRWTGMVYFGLCCLVATIAFLPWVFSAVITERGLAWAEPAQLTLAFLGEVFQSLIWGGSEPAPQAVTIALYAVLLGIGACVGLARRRTRLGALASLLPLLLCPPLIVITLQQVRYFFAERQVVFILPFLALLVAAGGVSLIRWLGGLPSRPRRRSYLTAGLSAVLLFALIYPQAPAIQSVYRTNRQNWRDALAFVAANAAPDDGIVVPSLDRSYFHYYSPHLADRVAVVHSVDQLQAEIDAHPATWTLFIPYTVQVAAPLAKWLESQHPLQLNFGAISLSYLRPGQTAADVMQSTVGWSQPQNPLALESLAYAYRDADMDAEANQALEQAIALASDKNQAADLHLLRGVFWQEAGNDQEAISAYRQTLALQPDNVEALLRLGGRLRAHDQVEEAAAAVEQALALDPSSAWAYRLLSEIRWQQGRQADAIQLLQAGLALDASNPDIHFRLANLLVATGDRAGAIASYRRYLELAPDGSDADAARSRIESLQSQGS